MLATACSHGFYYRPDPFTTGQNNIIINNGVAYAISQKGETSVILTAIKPVDGELELRIGYVNNNANRVDAIPEQIQVYTLNGKKLKSYAVYSADQYINKLQRKQNFAMAVQAFSDGYNNTAAGYSTSRTNAAVVSSNGSYAVGSSSTTTYDASKVSEADYRSRQELEHVATNFAQQNQNISQQLIRSNTLLKGQSIEGYVIVNTSKSFKEKIYVDVPIGNDKHEFMLIPNL
ncbi:MAG: hypothetical protein JWQ34_3156 [Mucilaginibacter sp.]|nr:hypothetical protein [Mucilaginibacter sp.]